MSLPLHQYLISIDLAVVGVTVVAFLFLAYIILSCLLSLAGYVSPTAQVTIMREHVFVLLARIAFTV